MISIIVKAFATKREKEPHSNCWHYWAELVMLLLQDLKLRELAILANTTLPEADSQEVFCSSISFMMILFDANDEAHCFSLNWAMKPIAD